MKYNFIQGGKTTQKNKAGIGTCKQEGFLSKKPLSFGSRVRHGLFVVSMLAFMACNGDAQAQKVLNAAKSQPAHIEEVEKLSKKDKDVSIYIIDKNNDGVMDSVRVGDKVYKLERVGTTKENELGEMKKDEESKRTESTTQKVEESKSFISVVEDFGRKVRDFVRKYPTLSTLFAVGLQLLGGLAAYIHLRLKL